jgi:hypothetical protein
MTGQLSLGKLVADILDRDLVLDRVPVVDVSK